MRMMLALIMLVMMAIPSAQAVGPEVYRTLEWDDLMPDGEWDLYDKQFQSLFDLDKLDKIEEGSAQDQMVQLGTFKTVPELDGKKVRLPGFMLPFEYAEYQKVTEFLLVPYFGACIHAPPPPPNQIVYVVSEKPIKVGDMWAPIWAKGTLRAKKNINDVGSAAYTLELEGVDPYTEPQ